MVEYAAFVREVEVWSPLGGGAYTCMMANRAGQTISEVGAPQGREGAAALVTRTVSHGRPGFATEGREHVRVALPLFTGEEVSSVVVLGCYSEAGRRGGVEVWEPSPEDDLVRVEGFYGGLSGFEMASRSTRFARGIGGDQADGDLDQGHGVPPLSGLSACLLGGGRLPAGLGL